MIVIRETKSSFKPSLHRGHFCSLSRFFFCDKSLEKNIFISNQPDFESKFIATNLAKFEVATKTETFLIFEIFRSHFRKSNHFWAKI